MRIAALTHVTDDCLTMLSVGLTQTVALTTAISHQRYCGQLGAAIRFSTQIGAPLWHIPLFLLERLARARGCDAE